MQEKKIDEIRDALCVIIPSMWKDDYTTVAFGTNVSFSFRRNAFVTGFIVDGVEIPDKNEKIENYYNELIIFMTDRVIKNQVSKVDEIHKKFFK